MAKGWESKAVEEQQATRDSAPSKSTLSKVASTRAYGDRIRARQSLELQREQILNHRTSNEHRRKALAVALAQIEGQLAELAQ